jgi:hypothetical protein
VATVGLEAVGGCSLQRFGGVVGTGPRSCLGLEEKPCRHTGSTGRMTQGFGDKGTVLDNRNWALGLGRIADKFGADRQERLARLPRRSWCSDGLYPTRAVVSDES